MTAPDNPALAVFLATITDERIWGQLLIQRASHFTLRHLQDRNISADTLRRISLADVRKLATFSESGQFRPLRSAPDLQRGWILHCDSDAELWRAVQEFYPGSIADWHALRLPSPPITNYREFTGRQTGMYRVTQLLTDEQAKSVALAGCHPRFCLKQRNWTIPGLSPDKREDKSEIPCLEPCAILLELARKAARIEQEEKLDVRLTRSELESFITAAEAALEDVRTVDRTGNIGAASNPRRLQLLLEKFKVESADQSHEEK